MSESQPIDGHIAADLPCTACGYNLRMLTEDAACPECGRTVRETLGFGLSHMPLTDLATLRCQARVQLAVLVIGPILAAFGLSAGMDGTCLVMFVVVVGVMAIWIAGSGLAMVALPSDRGPRISWGILVCLLPLVAVLALILQASPSEPSGFSLGPDLMAAGTLVALALWVWLLHYRIAQIAVEGGAEMLRRSAVVMMSLLLIGGAVLILLFANLLQIPTGLLRGGLVIWVLLFILLVLILHIVVLCQLIRLATRSLRVRRALDAFVITRDEGGCAGDSESCV